MRVGGYRADREDRETSTKLLGLTPPLCPEQAEEVHLVVHWRSYHEYQMEKMDENPQEIGVSKNNGTPKWMVYNGKPYQNWWFGGTPIFGNTQMVNSE